MYRVPSQNLLNHHVEIYYSTGFEPYLFKCKKKIFCMNVMVHARMEYVLSTDPTITCTVLVLYADHLIELY